MNPRRDVHAGVTSKLWVIIDEPESFSKPGSPTGGEPAIGITLSVLLHGRTGSPLTWVFTDQGGPHGLEISSETAWLFIDAAKELLDELH